MNAKILKLIENNARLSSDDIATATGLSVSEVESEIRLLEESGIIKGYKTIIDREKIDENSVSASTNTLNIYFLIIQFPFFRHIHLGNTYCN